MGRELELFPNARPEKLGHVSPGMGQVKDNAVSLTPASHREGWLAERDKARLEEGGGELVQNIDWFQGLGQGPLNKQYRSSGRNHL